LGFGTLDFEVGNFLRSLTGGRSFYSFTIEAGKTKKYEEKTSFYLKENSLQPEFVKKFERKNQKLSQ